MKSYLKGDKNFNVPVALFTRAWIEIEVARFLKSDYFEVALFTRAWIEIQRGVIIKT